MRIKKIKITSDSKVQITYEKTSNNGFWDEYSFSCSEAPRPELYKTLAALTPFVIDMCELPKEYTPRIAVRGVSFSYGGDKEVMGATISSQMELNDSYANLN